MAEVLRFDGTLCQSIFIKIKLRERIEISALSFCVGIVNDHDCRLYGTLLEVLYRQRKVASGRNRDERLRAYGWAD